MDPHKLMVRCLMFWCLLAVCLANDPPYNVIIVGAGPAGIAAASKLVDNTIESVLVLEAEGRIGGRVNTVHVNGSVLEMGAEWCHGEEGNLVFAMANPRHLLRHESNQQFDLLYSSHEPVDEDLKEEVANFTFGFAFEEGEMEPDEESQSFGQFYLKLYEEKILDKYKRDPKKLKFAVDAITMAEGLCLGEVGAFSWFNYPPSSHYKVSKGDQAMVWNGVGYETILDIMMKTYDYSTDPLDMENRIRLNKKVVKIEWLHRDFNGKVVVKCEDNSTYTADHVIFTPSLGVLKADHKKIFNPALSPPKQQAISKLGFEGVMKIICIFNDKWWKGEFMGRPLVWTAEDKANMPYKFPQGPIKDDQSWITHVSVIHAAENNPNALVAWVTGDIIQELEKASPSVIKEGMMHILETFLGNSYNITPPNQILHTRWCTNENFRGTYSFESVASRETDSDWNKILSYPLNNDNQMPVLLFAGEATNSDHYSTVHGAIESGYREARRILQLYGISDEK